ncbi:MAG TPA: ANTAR domain-containing protein [Candidatus Dormibacteraeota bacterium]
MVRIRVRWNRAHGPARGCSCGSPLALGHAGERDPRGILRRHLRAHPWPNARRSTARGPRTTRRGTPSTPTTSTPGFTSPRTWRWRSPIRRTTEQLTTAIVNRTVIGRAEGILMERFDLQPAQAFAVLTRLSQHNNIRLHLVAAELVKTRTLPGAEK